MLQCEKWIRSDQESLNIPLSLELPPADGGDIREAVQSRDQEDPLEEGMETHSCTLAWRIPWTEKPGKLQSTGSQRVRRD